jgi:hypothetical protein
VPSSPSTAAGGGESQIVALVDQIVAQIEGEIQQLLNAELAIEQEMLTIWSSLLSSGPRVA